MPRNTTSIGREAEKRAASFLKSLGYEIIAKNWRTRTCEIDIVARKDQTTYFVEVKYRATLRQGSGLDYITPAKLKQMKYAAEVWVARNVWSGNYVLGTVSIDGQSGKIDFIEQV